MENAVYICEVKRRGWSRRSRGNLNIGGNIHPLLWGGYEVYGVKCVDKSNNKYREGRKMCITCMEKERSREIF